MTPHKAIGVTAASMDSEYSGVVLLGIHEITQQHGYQLIIYTGIPEEFAPYSLASEIVDGWIVLVLTEGVQQLVEQGKPVVTVAATVDGVDTTPVLTDNRGGVKAAVEHLIEHGHSRIAFVGHWETEDIHQRYAGYLETLAEHTIEFDPELVFEASNDMVAGGRSAAQAMIAAGVPCTAIFAATDDNAIGLMTTLQAAGYRVPEDLAIVGFDNIEQAQHTTPPLTTVSQRPDRIGRIAGETLLQQINGELTSNEPIYAPTALVLRRSCGCPPAQGIMTLDLSERCGEQTWQEALQQQLIRLALYPAEPDPAIAATTLWPGVATFTAGLEAAILGKALPADTELEEACRQALLLTGDLETLHSLIKQLEQAARHHPSMLGNREAQRRVEAYASQILVEFMRGKLAASTSEISYINSLMQDNFDISMELLRAGMGKATQLNWLAGTPIKWGCIGLWSDPGEQKTYSLTIAGAYRQEGSLSHIIGQSLSAASFPPANLLPQTIAGGQSDDVVVLVPIKQLNVLIEQSRFSLTQYAATKTMGLLMLASSLESQLSSNKMVMWAMLLSVALDREALLTSLARQQETLRMAYNQQASLLKLVRFLQHELRGYTAGLEGVVPIIRRLLGQGDEQSSEQGFLIQALDETVNQMQELVQRLLILTREGSELSEAQYRILPIAPLLEQAKNEAATVAVRHDLQLQVSASTPPDLRVKGDPLFLSLALFTAVRNTVEALSQHGFAGAPTLELQAIEQDGCMTITILDNGRGFPQSLLTLQEERVKAGDSLLVGWSDKVGGSGLGMALIERVARLHGGNVSFGNRSDASGAWVRLTLPSVHG